jgi:hypothetical protein
MLTQADIERREKEAQNERELAHIAATHVCAECGGLLITPWSAQENKLILQCGTNKAHVGYYKLDDKLARLFAVRQSILKGGESTKAIDRGIQDYLNKKHSRKEKHLTTDATALQQYQERGLISEQQAMAIIRTTPGWSRAPENVVRRAAMVCRDYKLYPGIHVFLLVFGKGTDKESWVAAFGIKTNRLLASRKKPYKYIDGPRIASEEEARKHYLDEYDSILIYAYCKLEGLDGSTAEGWGTWPKADKVYGADKGNSKANMAEIRAERRALDRLCPGEMPSGFETVDEQYVPTEQEALPAGQSDRIVDSKTGEIIEGDKATQKTSTPAAPFGVCPIHNVQLVNGKFGIYCPRKVTNAKGASVFCKGGKDTREASAAQPPLMDNKAPAPEEEPR